MQKNHRNQERNLFIILFIVLVIINVALFLRDKIDQL